MKKIDVVKIAGYVGTALSIAATLACNYSQHNEMKKTVAEEVAKALSEKK